MSMPTGQTDRHTDGRTDGRRTDRYKNTLSARRGGRSNVSSASDVAGEARN